MKRTTNISLSRSTPLDFLFSFIVGLGVLGVVALMFLGVILGAFLWPYTINTWLEYVGKDPVVVWWHGVLLSFVPVVGRLCMIPAAVATWIAMLFLI